MKIIQTKIDQSRDYVLCQLTDALIQSKFFIEEGKEFIKNNANDNVNIDDLWECSEILADAIEDRTFKCNYMSECELDNIISDLKNDIEIAFSECVGKSNKDIGNYLINYIYEDEENHQRLADYVRTSFNY